MRKVILATLPCLAGGIYYFGWRSLAVVIISCLFGFLTEYSFCRYRKEPVSEAVFVTAVLYALILPPNVPIHIVIFGIVFAILFGKEVFGGFGRNIFNPAMVGRCFVYICFPLPLTARWAPAAQGALGALGSWSTITSADSITSATPMALLKAGGPSPDIVDLLIGRLAGSMGVTSAILILIGGLYLYFTKTANRTTIITTIVSYCIANIIFDLLNFNFVPAILPSVLGGGFLFGTFFMATDPVSSPSTESGRIIFGCVVGIFSAIIADFSVFNGGFMFALLFANMFVPIIDFIVKQQSAKKKSLTAK